MKTTITVAVVGALLTLLSVIPTVRASFTDTTSNDGNAFSTRQPVRVTTYQINENVFTGTTYNLQLNHDLSSDYFVIMRGGAWDSNISSSGGYPSSDYARVAGDPHGNLGATTSPDVLLLQRRTTDGPQGSQASWQGQVTVVESLDSTDTAGFRLLGVETVRMTGTTTNASATSSAAWTEINQVGLYGGIYGGGAETSASNAKEHASAWSRLWPTGSNTINLERRSKDSRNLAGETTFTVYAVEWGDEWTIQRVLVDGSNGGNGVDTPNEYTTQGIDPVTRDNTFVLAYGNTWERGLGNGWEGQVFTLGNGVQQKTTENRVAIGAHYSGSRHADVYIHTHPRLHVDYRFMPEGSIPRNESSGMTTVDGALGPENRSGTGIGITEGLRFAVLSNASHGNGTWYPRPMVSARHTGDTKVTWYRSRSGQPGTYWLQSIDFGEIWR
jgi:hypothetical protein